MLFQIDWVSFSVGFVICLLLTSFLQIIGSYRRLKQTRHKIAQLDKKLEEINRVIASNKENLGKAISQHQGN
ncbi:MAG: hypothetical protein WC901_05435 [Candidatus Margulisiibacteriota bacterium]